MSEKEPHTLKIIGTLLKCSLGFLLLYYGIKIYNEIPDLSELNQAGGNFAYSEVGIELPPKSVGVLVGEEFHFTLADQADDSIMINNMQQANSIKEKLLPGDKITFWYPQNILPADRGREFKQLAINDKIFIPYKPNRAIPIVMICMGSVIIVLLGFLIKLF